MPRPRNAKHLLSRRLVDTFIKTQLPTARTVNVAFYGFVGVEFYKSVPDEKYSQVTQALKAFGLLVILLINHYVSTIFAMDGTIYSTNAEDVKLEDEEKKEKKADEAKDDADANASNQGEPETDAQLVRGARLELQQKKEASRVRLFNALLVQLIFLPLGGLGFFTILHWCIFGIENILEPLLATAIIIIYFFAFFRQLLKCYSEAQSEQEAQ